MLVQHKFGTTPLTHLFQSLVLLASFCMASRACAQLTRIDGSVTEAPRRFDDIGTFDHADEHHHHAAHNADGLAAQAPATFTYSYSNLFDGDINLTGGFTDHELIVAVEESFALWASVAPLTFIEQDDSGPPVSDNTYRKSTHAEIRIGHHEIFGDVLAHAFFPGSNGRDSDVHMDSENQIWNEGTFFTTMTHEIGHAIGLEHFDLSTAVMNSSLTAATTFGGLEGGRLFDPDVRSITKIYGSGAGEVVVSRKWSGGPQGMWAESTNWNKGHYPTRRSTVTVDTSAEIAIAQPNLKARAIDIVDEDIEVTITRGSLHVLEDLTLGSTANVPQTNVVHVEDGNLRIDGNLRMAEGPQTESILNITGGSVEVGNRITKGDGVNRIVMSGGTLTVSGTKPGPNFVSSDSAARLLIPKDASLGQDWTIARFDDSTWDEATASLGYDRDSEFEGLFATDVEAQMFDRSTSVYLRIPFTADNPAALNSLQLDMNFDDGFVAYLNGQRVAARNAANVVDFEERALTSVTDDDAKTTTTLDIARHLGKLVDGENVLAIHGLNRSKTNDDFLIVPALRSNISDGSISVDSFEFSGGRLFGVKQIHGDVTLKSGEFSPNGATINSGPSELRIVGRLEVGDEATVRLDMNPTTSDSIVVDGNAFLGGTLQLDGDTAIDILDNRGSVDQSILLDAESIEGNFSLATFNDMPLGHMGNGFFRELIYTESSISLLSFRTIVGDSNGDGAFDSGDLVFVFQSSEYEDGVEANSDWTNGDWNGDFEFDSGDFVAAFQTGLYETPSILPNTVPEPNVGLLVIVAILCGVDCCRRCK